jgi:hypothetical protein
MIYNKVNYAKYLRLHNKSVTLKKKWRMYFKNLNKDEGLTTLWCKCHHNQDNALQ